MVGEMFGAMDAIRQEREGKKEGVEKGTILSPPHSSSVPKCLMYSGHDTTIAPLLAAFHATHGLMRPTSTEPGWPLLGSNMIIELLEATPDVKQTENPQLNAAKRAAAHRSMEDSLAPLPPSAVEDDAHHLPKQDGGDRLASVMQPAKPDGGFQPHGSGSSTSSLSRASKSKERIPTRASLVVSPQSRWFLRLLVDHKEVSIIPYEEYQHLRKQYEVKDWIAECKQKSNDVLPPHQW
jgi:hypothetical protein